MGNPCDILRRDRPSTGAGNKNRAVIKQCFNGDVFKFNSPPIGSLHAPAVSIGAVAKDGTVGEFDMPQIER